MKDRQTEPTVGTSRIPFVSPLLHCIAMSVIVYLRSSFGFNYLRPRAVFFAISWVLVVFSAYAFLGEGNWRIYGRFCVFALGGVILYWIHFAIAFSRELYRAGKHDNDSGVAHASRLFFRNPASRTERMERIWRTCIEPGAIVVLSFVSWQMGERLLAAWLVVAAIALSLKEFLNFWFSVRKETILRSMKEDAEALSADSPVANAADRVPEPTRKPIAKRVRGTVLSPLEELRIKRYAELLELSEPYRLEEAEPNYRRIIRQFHTDTGEGGTASDAGAADLSEAIAFFRQKPGT